MTSSLKLWIPLTLLTGWALGHGTSRLATPAPVAESLPRVLERLSAQHEALLERLARVEGGTRCATSANGVDLDALRSELRMILREERSVMAGRAEPPQGSQPGPSRDEAPSPESLAALEQGQRLLDDALRTKRWGDAQAEELRSLSAALTFHQQQQLTQKLIVSINRGDLVAETTGFPF